METLLILAFTLVYGNALKAYNDPGTLDIGAFNIQVFGTTKMGKPLIQKILPQIVRLYDLLLVQEIRDGSGKAIQELLKLVNDGKTEYRYKMLLSPRLGRTVSKEAYAYIYREDWLTAIDHYTYDDLKDVFQREPYIAKFSTNGRASIKEFAVVGIHTSPDEASDETSSLVDVYHDVVAKWKMYDVILMGDFNADCDYVKHWDAISLATDKRFYWLIDDTKDTTTKSTDCTYDRIVVSGENLLKSIIPLSPSVFNFKENYGLTQDETEDVSDHFPVQMQIRSREEMNIRHTTGFAVEDTTVAEDLVGSIRKVYSLPKSLPDTWIRTNSYTKSGRYLGIKMCRVVDGAQNAIDAINELSKSVPTFFPVSQKYVVLRLYRQLDPLNFLARGFGRYQTLHDFYQSVIPMDTICLNCDLTDKDRPDCDFNLMRDIHR